jgi:hypothetical protein
MHEFEFEVRISDHPRTRFSSFSELPPVFRWQIGKKRWQIGKKREMQLETGTKAVADRK